MAPRILLQTTIPTTRDDWSIERFSLLARHLRSLGCDVVARDREASGHAADPVLRALDRSDFDQLWLFAVDTGDGLAADDCAGITRFHEQGGGILSTRDHQDLGSSLCTLGGIGAAHFFHSRNPDPDASRHSRDDVGTQSISWPNYHSGRNGDYQLLAPVGSPHELLQRTDGAGVITWFPAHPHEGAVGVPAGDARARTIATGRSLATGRPFNLAVAFERATGGSGRGVAEASFHHFADYNWDPDCGAPSFVSEPPGDGVKREPHKLEDIKAYVGNLARWLAPERGA
jgi:hypothetical protein